jgi:branched-chain amino acid transport system permease protein
VSALQQKWRELSPRGRAAVVVAVPLVLYALLYFLLDPSWPGSTDHFSRKVPYEQLVIGAIYGTANALLAIGLILIYRTNRFINFSYAAMGSLFGYLAVVLHLEKGVPYFVVFPIAVVLGTALGAGSEVVVFRRFKDSSRLLITVASIGFAQLLGGIEALVATGKNGLRGQAFYGAFTVPISWSIRIGDTSLFGDQLLIIVVVPLVIAGLAWFLLKTDAGVAVRAAAENADRALLLGIPIRRLSTIVWAVAGGLATLTFMLRAPFAGVNLSITQGPVSLLPALAAAVVARMESLPVAFGTAVALGMTESIVRNNGEPTAASLVVFIVILVALLLQRGKLSRAMLGEGGLSFGGVVKATPTELRNLREVKWVKYGLVAVTFAVMAWIPSTFGVSNQIAAVYAMVAAMAAVSLVIMTGWGGHISLGQFAFVGIGAVVAGNLIQHRVDFIFAVIAAGAAGGILALVVGLPALRIKGPFLAVTTLAFAVALDSWFLNPTQREGIMPSLRDKPFLWERFDLAFNYDLYLTTLVFLGLSILVALGVRRARSGRVVIATRDNQRAADAAAVPTTNIKLSAFLLAGVIAGMGGAFYMLAVNSIGQNQFEPALSLDVFTTAIIGGIGSITGAISGVLLFQYLNNLQALGPYRALVSGTGLLVVLYLLPGGLGQLLFAVRDRYLRWVAERRGILVPSLVADKRVDEEGQQHAADEVDLLAGALSSEPQPEPVGAAS